MRSEWRQSTWGQEVSLEYGKALRGYDKTHGKYRVFGSNGPIGWTSDPLTNGPGVILGRKGACRGTEYSRDPFWVIDTAYYVVPRTDLSHRWLYYAIRHHKLGEIDDGSPIPSTTRSAVYVKDVSIPPLPIQHRIAHILGALDDKIELNRQMNQTLEKMAAAIFKSWFIDFDPVRAKAAGEQPSGLKPEIAALFPNSFEDSELGEIPKGWQIRSLDEIACFLNGLALQKFPSSDPGNNFPVIKIAELRNGVSTKSGLASKGVPEKYIIKDGDFLFSWSGSLLAKFWTGGEGALNQHLFKVTSVRYPMWFVSFWVYHHLDEFQFIAASKATTMGHIQRGHLKAAMTLNPPDAVLAKFSIRIAPFVEKIIQNNIESRTLSSLRDTLLPKLMRGELRVAEVERIVGRAL